MMTNYERIMTMGISELADYLSEPDICGCAFCVYRTYDIKRKSTSRCGGRGMCKYGIETYLKKEADEL